VVVVRYTLAGGANGVTFSDANVFSNETGGILETGLNCGALNWGGVRTLSVIPFAFTS